MLRRKKNVKRILVALIFTFSILLTNSQIFSVFNADVINRNQSDFLDDDNFPLTSDSYLSDYYFAGSGDDQDVRIYTTNSSSTLNNEGNFEIPSMSSLDPAYLSYGNLNFTFQNNYTSNYILEDTNALDANDFIKFNYDEDISSITMSEGSILGSSDMNSLVDGSSSTSIIFNSTSAGFLRYNITNDFTGTSYSRSSPTINLAFNRSLILGLIATYDLNINFDAYLTLKVFDTSLSTWVNIADPFLVNSSFNPHILEERFTNENLNYIDLSEISHIQFYFDGVDNKEFTVTLKEYNLAATYAFDLPITSNEYVTLEFDLKGESSTINGFYAWIRTLDLNEAINTELNVTLYKANSTIARTQENLANNILMPSMQMDTFIINYNDYHGDSLTYFQFDTLNTDQSPLYNYFITIKSNRSQLIHSLVTIPRFTFGDPDSLIDHLLLKTEDDGLNWDIATKDVTGTYFTQQLDAAAFKVNVVRGYMPSDFSNPYNETDNLAIQNLAIEDQSLSYGPYSSSSSLTWGLGNWDYNFTSPIASVPPNNHKINLNWNETKIKGFKFNVSYTVKAYWEMATNSRYNVSYNTKPVWELNFTLNLNYENFDNWNFLEFWYVFPNDFQAHNLTNPNFNDIYELVTNETNGEHRLLTNPTYGFINVSKEIVNGISGVYSLNLTSSNLIHDMHSYINYMDNLWETNGFMYGDNMSIRVDIRDHEGVPAIGGDVNAVLFYPNNSTKYPGSELNSAVGVLKDGSLIFDFNNASILYVTKNTPLLGNYYLGFFWKNGSAIGCKTLKLYIDTYDVIMNSFFYEPDLDQNILEGIVDKVFENYSILTASVDEIINAYDPNYYAVNNSVDMNYVYDLNGEEIPISITSFKQNETFLNPDEDIIITTSIQNHHDFLDLNVQLNVQLVSLVNDEWIIDEQITPIQTIKPGIDPNGDDVKDFSVMLNMPSLQPDGIWQGINAPIRKGGAKTRVIIYLEYGGDSYEVDIFESNEYSLIVNSTQSEFEASIISLKYDTTITGASLLKPFARDECQYSPNQTTFVINIYDQNFVSSYEQFISSFSLIMHSKFSNISVTPGEPIYGQNFNLTSDLTSEFGESISNENVSFLYFNGVDWENLSSQISGENGTTVFEVNTLSLPSEEQYIFQLVWNGGTYISGNNQNVTVDLFIANNNISIYIQSSVDRIFKNGKSSIHITLTNIGDSELVISNVNVLLQPTAEYEIGEINYIELSRFLPDEMSEMVIELHIPDVDQIILTVSIEATNPITDELVIFESTETFTIYDAPLDLLLTASFILIMIGIFLVVWGLMVVYVRRTIKRIEAPIEAPEKKKPRRGRYVTVSEIPTEDTTKQEPSKKIKKKKKAQIEPEEDKKTDLDSLLEEEGL